MTVQKELTGVETFWLHVPILQTRQTYGGSQSRVCDTVKTNFCAEEGDVRLVDEEQVSNWITGRLQVFFEGSWSQVCATGFDAVDANVACRQLGFGSGTVVPQILSSQEIEERATINVFPDIAIIGSGCTGAEDRLLDCAPTPPGDYFNDFIFGRDCENSDGVGLVIGCVATPLQGPAAGESDHAFMPASSQLQACSCLCTSACGLSSSERDYWHARSPVGNVRNRITA